MMCSPKNLAPLAWRGVKSWGVPVAQVSQVVAKNARQKGRGSSLGRCGTRKKDLASIRSNSDLEFFFKLSPRMGPATAACKKQKVKSFL